MREGNHIVSCFDQKLWKQFGETRQLCSRAMHRDVKASVQANSLYPSHSPARSIGYDTANMNIDPDNPLPSGLFDSSSSSPAHTQSIVNQRWNRTSSGNQTHSHKRAKRLCRNAAIAMTQSTHQTNPNKSLTKQTGIIPSRNMIGTRLLLLLIIIHSFDVLNDQVLESRLQKGTTTVEDVQQASKRILSIDPRVSVFSRV